MEELAKAAVLTNQHGTTNWAEAFAWIRHFEHDEDDGIKSPEKYSVISGAEIAAEASKLEQLCWESGFRPSREALLLILSRFAALVSEHAGTAQKEKEEGLLLHQHRRPRTWD